MAMDGSAVNGRLLLLHGEPGTGKTTALRALAQQWRSWCQVDCVLDPERLFSRPGLPDERGAGQRRRGRAALAAAHARGLRRADQRRGEGGGRPVAVPAAQPHRRPARPGPQRADRDHHQRGPGARCTPRWSGQDAAWRASRWADCRTRRRSRGWAPRAASARTARRWPSCTRCRTGAQPVTVPTRPRPPACTSSHDAPPDRTTAGRAPGRQRPSGAAARQQRRSRRTTDQWVDNGQATDERARRSRAGSPRLSPHLTVGRPAKGRAARSRAGSPPPGGGRRSGCNPSGRLAGATVARAAHGRAADEGAPRPGRNLTVRQADHGQAGGPRQAGDPRPSGRPRSAGNPRSGRRAARGRAAQLRQAVSNPGRHFGPR